MRLRTHAYKPPRRLLQQVAAAYRPFGRLASKSTKVATDKNLEQLDAENVERDDNHKS